MPLKGCIVLIPARPGGVYSRRVFASSSLEAAALALREHHVQELEDDVVIRVVVDGKDTTLFDAVKHNSKQPNYLHSVRQARAWLRNNWGKTVIG